MSMEVFLMLLLAVSIITGLFTEALKKVLDEWGKVYKSNILAGAVSIVLSVVAGIGYMIMVETQFNAKMAVILIALVLLSWLCAMVGYDKVMQAIAQIKVGKAQEGTKREKQCYLSQWLERQTKRLLQQEKKQSKYCRKKGTRLSILFLQMNGITKKTWKNAASSRSRCVSWQNPLKICPCVMLHISAKVGKMREGAKSNTMRQSLTDWMLFMKNDFRGRETVLFLMNNT